MITGYTSSRLLVTSVSFLALLTTNCFTPSAGIPPRIGMEARPAHPLNMGIAVQPDKPSAASASFTVSSNEDLERISHMQRLRALKLHCKSEQLDLSYLTRLQNLERLQLSFSITSPSAFADSIKVPAMPLLKHLGVHYLCTIDNASPTPILTSPGSELRTLVINGAGCTYSIASGTNLTNLRTLDVNSKLSTQEVIKQMPRLTTLSLGDRFSISPAGTTALKSLLSLQTLRAAQSDGLPLDSWRQLRHLEIGNANGRDLAKIATIKSLQNLRVKFDSFTDNDLAALGTLPHLRDLDISIRGDFTDGKLSTVSGRTGSGLADLSKENRVERLRIDGLAISDELFQAVSKLTALKSLFIADDGNEVSLTQAKLLNKLSNLQEADIPWPLKNMTEALRQCSNLSQLRSVNLQNQDLRDGDLAILSNFPNLRTLNLSGNHLTDRSASQLTKLSRLQNLDLSGNQLSGRGLSTLLRLPLVTLQLNNTLLTDKSLASAGTLHSKTLEHLALSRNNISGSSLQFLKGLSALSNLALAQTHINDKSLQNLLANQRLRSINIEDTDITEHGVRTLSKLPNLREVIAFNSAIKHGAKLPASLEIATQSGWHQVDPDSKSSQRLNTAPPVDSSDLPTAERHAQAREWQQAANSFTTALNNILHTDHYICSVEGNEQKQQLLQAYTGRGATLAALGQYDRALQDLNRANEISRASAYAKTHRGYVYLKTGRLQEALADLNRAIDIRPATALAYEYRSSVHTALGNTDLASNDRAVATMLTSSPTIPVKRISDRSENLTGGSM